MEFYQWLLTNNGFSVSPIGYFLYVNGIKEGCFYSPNLEGVMRFNTTLIDYIGDIKWVEPTIKSAIDCLTSDTKPNHNTDCESCRYFFERLKI